MKNDNRKGLEKLLKNTEKISEVEDPEIILDKINREADRELENKRRLKTIAVIAILLIALSISIYTILAF